MSLYDYLFYSALPLSDHHFYISNWYQLVTEMKDAILTLLAGREAAEQSCKLGVK